MTESEFVKWVATASPGQSIVYHTGLLMKDRLASETLGKVAWGFACDVLRPHGQVELKQRLVNRENNGVSTYDYIATKLSPIKNRHVMR